jgi:hypothetical protein
MEAGEGTMPREACCVSPDGVLNRSFLLRWGLPGGKRTGCPLPPVGGRLQLLQYQAFVLR